MRIIFPLLSALIFSFTAFAEEEQQKQIEEIAPVAVLEAPAPAREPLQPFTGKVLKNKVRLRIQPNFDGTPIKELNKDQLILVQGEADDFYAIEPLADMKAYIFRTYVLDDVVEGTRVNVRLKPDLESPVIAQLNSGDKVQGHIYGSSNKWMEIKIPVNTRFYIAKEYVEKVGDINYLSRMEKRQEEVYRLLITTKTLSDTEMLKPFDKVNIDGVVENFNRIIAEFKDFPDAVGKAKEYLASLQDNFTKKKIAFLEEQTANSSKNLEDEKQKLSEELEQHKTKLVQLEKKIQKEKEISQVVAAPINQEPPAPKTTQIPYNMSTWIPVEEQIIAKWSQESGNDNPATFYDLQKEKAITLKGVIDNYNRPVKNKPGDFMLLNTGSKLPIAFLYSTQVNLQQYLGHEVSVVVVPRDNYNYAFPAYFVISIE